MLSTNLMMRTIESKTVETATVEKDGAFFRQKMNRYLKMMAGYGVMLLCLWTSISYSQTNSDTYTAQMVSRSSLEKKTPLQTILVLSKIRCAARCTEDNTCLYIYHQTNNTCYIYKEDGSLPQTEHGDQSTVIYMKQSVAILCPTDWKIFEDAYYCFVERKLNWTKANTACLDMGGYLVEICTRSEDNFIGKFAADIGESVWTGGIYDEKTEDWIWDFSGNTIDYSNWYPGEPLHGYADGYYQMYMLISYGWSKTTMWDDGFVYEEMYFACERDD